VDIRKALIVVMVANLIGTLLNMFGTIFEVAGLVIAGGIFIVFALIGAIVCLIFALK
jgi:hypothetical protein